MEIASLVIEHNFDRELLEQIDTLRMIRLGLAEKMLLELDETRDALSTQYPSNDGNIIDKQELQKELKCKISDLRERLKRRDVIFEDEINFYVDLLDKNNDLGEELEKI